MQCVHVVYMDTIMMKLTALEVKLGDFRDQNGQRE